MAWLLTVVEGKCSRVSSNETIQLLSSSCQRYSFNSCVPEASYCKPRSRDCCSHTWLGYMLLSTDVGHDTSGSEVVGIVSTIREEKAKEWCNNKSKKDSRVVFLPTACGVKCAWLDMDNSEDQWKVMQKARKKGSSRKGGEQISKTMQSGTMSSKVIRDESPQAVGERDTKSDFSKISTQRSSQIGRRKREKLKRIFRTET